MTDHLEPEEIERRLEKDRAALANDLDELKSKFSLETIVRQAVDQIRDHSDDITASVSRAVKENPLGVAVTGVGLAWLIFGDKTKTHHTRASPTAAGIPVSSPPLGQQDYGHQSADRSRHNPASQDKNLPSWLKDDHHHGGGGHNVASKARDAMAQSKDKLADASGAMRDRMHDTADSVRDTADTLRERTAQWRARLSEGTEHLSEEGRARVIAAREKASEARDAAMNRMHDSKERAVDLFEDHPLIVGALAVAAGAALAAALPHTRMEDEQFGETSDALIREAERILSEETEKLGAAMETAADEAGDLARDVATKAGSVVETAAASVGERASELADDATASDKSAAQDKQKTGDAEKSATGNPRPVRDIPS
ncbi:MAG: DUF3618 domain-containing protein [Rhodobacterales bacterium]